MSKRAIAIVFVACSIFLFASMRIVCRVYKLPTQSMEPTINKGDRILANMLAYKFHPPKRGDIVIFAYPLDTSKDYIKRIVGMPGEQLEIKNYHVYINGQVLSGNFEYYNMEEWQYGKTGQVVQIPSDAYFVLGDNSSHSKDSRAFGVVNKIKGKAFFAWPTEGKGHKI